MTKKEAIARIKDHIEIHKLFEQRAIKTHEALEMAIKVLEQPELHDDVPDTNVGKIDDGDELDEAIRDFERNAQNDDDNFHLTGAKCFNGCAEYEWRIVSWLRELKERRERDERTD